MILRLALVAFILWSLPAAAQERFTGKVVAVADGDTISVLRDGRAVRVRLEGIDCPEKGQDFSQRAKQFTSDPTFGKEVTIDVRDVDRYRRLVARVYVAGKDVSVALVEAGLAWHYTRYLRDLEPAKAERAGRLAKQGLWALANPVPPWEFRRQGRMVRKDVRLSWVLPVQRLSLIRSYPTRASDSTDGGQAGHFANLKIRGHVLQRSGGAVHG